MIDNIGQQLLARRLHEVHIGHPKYQCSPMLHMEQAAKILNNNSFIFLPATRKEWDKIRHPK